MNFACFNFVLSFSTNILYDIYIYMNKTLNFREKTKNESQVDQMKLWHVPAVGVMQALVHILPIMGVLQR